MTMGLILCPLCAKQTKTCCIDTDIYIALGDVRRIDGFTSNRDFYEFRTPYVPSYKDQSDDTLWDALVFLPDGSRRVIKRNESGACPFFGHEGCTLSISFGQLICGLHPYMYNARCLYPDISPGCPIHLLPAGTVLETSIKGFMNEDAVNWCHMVYEEITEKGDDA